MSNDKKTLADVQPGGRVRLGDGWTGWATQYPNKMPKLCGAREIAELNHYPEEGQRLLFLAENPVHVGDLVDAARAALPFVAFAYSKGVAGAEEAGRAIEAALAAQPSPGGQGDAVTPAMVDAAADVLARWAGHDDGSRWVHEARDALEAALAARQPVDENYEVWAQNAENVAAELTDERAIKALRFAARGIRCAASQPVRIYGCCAQPERELHTAECPNMSHLAARQPVGVAFPWENFPAYLIDKCEGDTISEEGLQQALASMAKDERYCLAARQPVGEPVAYTDGNEFVCAAEYATMRGLGHDGNGWRPLYAAPPAQAVDLGTGIKAIASERERQLCIEGFSRDSDEQYREGELARAATAYVQLAAMDLQVGSRKHIASQEPPFFWPWAQEWWKPVDARRDLVRAGALIAAQIDLIDSQAVGNG
ncbi:hypothetical protein [Stenotrophomonas maltophilia]|uniref:hypothetical protein n=2 Tax=Gammaproteobacteria TaxID=1236 RepID=UPI002E793D8D|nr:hypothetical protein [Stenotrophomonas maltophilia]